MEAAYSLLASNKENTYGQPYRLDDVVDELLGLVDLLLSVGHDETVQVLLLVAGVRSVRATFTLFDGSFAANGNLGE